MRKIISQYVLGEIGVEYLQDESGQTELMLFPEKMKDRVVWDKRGKTDSLVQIMVEGDAASAGFAAGHTARNCETIRNLHYVGQICTKTEKEIVIETCLNHVAGLQILHRLIYQKNKKALKVKTQVSNKSMTPVVLTMLSSFSIGMLTPFEREEAMDRLRYYRIRSKWSAEGKVEVGDIEELQLEPSWSGHGVSVEKFGEVGSLPVRKFFPFAAIEDVRNGVIWAAQIGCGSSWQMEFFRKDESLCLSGGIADFEFGHWKKKLVPEECFSAPEAYLTVAKGDFDQICQRLCDLQEVSGLFRGENKKLPVIFNEFCTTWGKPTQDGVKEIVDKIKDKDFDYFVIDAGWYADKVNGWESNMGDWEIAEGLFSDGLEKTVKYIKDAGMKAGIWFEPEVIGRLAMALQHEEHLLKRNGYPICSGERYFWDMRDDWVKKYLREKVIGFIKKYGFEYVKLDYNESIGVGCDGAESLGQGLYEVILASKYFFDEIHKQIPGICIELCSSGGHRLEPSFLKRADMASFSDAHEELEIPVIAANLHRCVRPEKIQIWSVIRETDSVRRICYSMTSALLGILCISGNVLSLNSEQWQMIDQGILFYQKLDKLLKDGITYFYGKRQRSYRRLEGWQAVLREGKDDSYACLVIHCFEPEQQISLDLREEYLVEWVYEAEKHVFSLKQKRFAVRMHQPYDAMAILLKRTS